MHKYNLEAALSLEYQIKIEYKLSALKLTGEDLLTAKLHFALNEWGIANHHVPNGEYRTKRGASKLKAMGVVPGVADLCILGPKGRVLWLELKFGANSQSKTQKAFQKRCIALGHRYALAWSYEEAMRIVYDFITN